MANNFIYSQPVKIFFGEGKFDDLGSVLEEMGVERCVIVCGRHFSPKAKALQETDSRIVGVFSGVEQNPQLSGVIETTRLARETKADAVLGVGGGSAIDTAKFAAAIALGDGEAIEYYRGEKPFPAQRLTIIAVPTTAGTGSEVTNVSVITGVRRHIKFGVLSPYLVPNTAVLDPLATVSLPANITAATGADALTHCIEAYASFVDFCIGNAEALGGIRMVVKYLPIAYADGSNLEAREQMALAAMMAGAAFNINNLGLCHQMAHQLSAYFGVPHGVANAVLLPEVMRFNMRAIPEKYADVAEAMGCDIRGLSAEEAAIKGIEAVEAFFRSIGIPKYLEDVGVDKARVPDMAITALEDGVGATNPIATTVEECEQVYYRCFRD